MFKRFQYKLINNISQNGYIHARKASSESYLNKESYYDILQVPQRATKATLKSQFYKLSLKYHPDLNPNDEKSHSQFLKLNEAYSVLSDDFKRKDYDRNFSPTKLNSRNTQFSNQFRNRNTTKVKQYSNAKFNGDDSRFGTKTSYDEKEYSKMHYSADNTPFRFHSQSFVDDRPNIETASKTVSRFFQTVVLVVGSFFFMHYAMGKTNYDSSKDSKKGSR